MENIQIFTCPVSKPLVAKLRLPSSDKEWRDANLYFSLHVTSMVIDATDIELKNLSLSEGIYKYFAATYGTHTKKSQSQNLSVTIDQLNV